MTKYEAKAMIGFRARVERSIHALLKQLGPEMRTESETVWVRDLRAIIDGEADRALPLEEAQATLKRRTR